jgi:hypothetical protein
MLPSSKHAKKLFMLYNDLWEKAKGFCPDDYKQGKTPTMPNPHRRAEICGLELNSYSDTIAIWHELNPGNLDVSNPSNLHQCLEGIRTKASKPPVAESWTPERIALLNVIDLWLNELQSGVQIIAPKRCVARTTLLPVKSACTLRLKIVSTMPATYDVREVSIPVLTGTLKTPEGESKSVNCESLGGTMGSVQFAGEIKRYVYSTATGLHKPSVELWREGQKCDPLGTLVKFYNPLPITDTSRLEENLRTRPSFETRKAKCREIFTKIRELAQDPAITEPVGIGIRGQLMCGKNPVQRVAFIGEDCEGCAQARHLGMYRAPGALNEWNFRLTIGTSVIEVPLVVCRMGCDSEQGFLGCDRVKARIGKVIFICELPTIPRRNDEDGLVKVFKPEPLDQDKDIKPLLEQIGVVGGDSLHTPSGRTGDGEIRRRLGSLFLHFDEDVHKIVWEFAQDFPEMAVDVCERILNLRKQYVNGEDALLVVRDAIKGTLQAKRQVVWDRIKGTSNQEDRVRVARKLAELQKYFRGVQISQFQGLSGMDPFQVLLEMKDIIIEKGSEYSFRSRFYREVAQDPPKE